MNIKSNEILLLNKIKMEGEKNTNTATLEPIAEEQSAEKGMKALMFQGMKALMSNPYLAQEAGVGEDIEIKKADPNAEEYVAPFKSNLAFGHKSSFLNKGTKVLAGVLLAGAATGVTGCKDWPDGDTTIINKVEIKDFTQFMSQMTVLLSQMNAKLDKIDESNRILQQMQQTLLEVLAAVNDGKMTMEQGFDNLFNQFIVVQTNQELILQQLQDNGMSQDEANAYIQQLIFEVQAGNMSAKEAWSEIIAKLGVTNDLLANIYATLQASLSKLIEQGNDLTEIARGILDNTGKTNDKLDELNGTAGNVVVELGNLIVANETIGANIQAAIAQQTLSINANVSSNIAALAQAVHMDIKDFKATMIRMGITEMQLQQMSVYELLQAIDRNTNEVKNVKNLVNQLLVEYQAGRISAEQFAQQIIDAMTKMNATLADISATLNDAYAKLNEIDTNIKDAATKIIKNQDRAYVTLTKLVDNSDELKDQLDVIISGQETMTTRIENAIKESTISQNANVSANIAQLAAVVRMSEADLKATIVRMGITEMQLQQMSVQQLLKAIHENTNEIKNLKFIVKDFLQEYKDGKITAEQFAQKILEVLNQIDGKIDTLITFINDAYAQIHADLEAIKQNTANIDAKAGDISEQLNIVIDGQVALGDKIQKAIEEGTISQNANVTANFGKLAGLLGMTAADLKATLIQMHISDQMLQTMSVQELLKAINNNTNEVKALRTQFEKFVAQYKSGQITAQQFAQKVINLLGDISAKLDGISVQLTQLYNDVMSALKDANKTLVKLDANTKITNSYLSELNNKVQIALEKQDSYKQDFADLKQLASDNNSYQAQILAELKAQPDKYQDMLNKLGITLTQALNMTATQFQAKIDQAMANYDNTEGKQTKLLTDIYNELKNHQGGTIGDNKDVVAAINALKADMNADVTTVNAKLQEILNALKGIADQLEDLITEVKTISSNISQMNTYLGHFNNYWTQALGNLGDYSSDLAEIKQLLQTGNATTAEINAKIKEIKQDIEAMKASIARAEAFLNNIKTNSQIIINKLNEFGDIDYDRLETAMQNVSDKDYQRYSELLKNLGLDPSKFESIKELVQAIKDGVDDIQKDTKYGKKIYDILKDVDWSKPECASKIDQVIELLNNFEINCNCKCNGGSGGNPDEGGHNVDDLDDLING